MALAALPMNSHNWVWFRYSRGEPPFLYLNISYLLSSWIFRALVFEMGRVLIHRQHVLMMSKDSVHFKHHDRSTSYMDWFARGKKGPTEFIRFIGVTRPGLWQHQVTICSHRSDPMLEATFKGIWDTVMSTSPATTEHREKRIQSLYVLTYVRAYVRTHVYVRTYVRT